MLRTQFEEDLQELHEKFFVMGTTVAKAIDKSVQSFVKHDKELAKEVISEDEVINQYETQLEKKSFEMIALQQPVTTDLRTIVTVMKASSDLERMGDHSVSIAKGTILVKGTNRILPVEDMISQMSSVVKIMVNDVMSAYIKKDTKKAYEIAKMDEQVNNSFKEIYEKTINTMQQQPETVVAGTEYLQIASYLERIGDYVTNICEWIIYLAEGKLLELNNNHHL